MLKDVLGPPATLIKGIPPVRDIFKTLAQDEGIQNSALDFLQKRLTSGATKLSSIGEVVFNNAIEDIKNSQKILLSEQIGILTGSYLTVTGIDALKSLGENGALLILNHSSKGHLRGYGNTIAVSKAISDNTGQDPIWAHGVDKSTFQDLARPKLSHSIETITIRDKNDNGLSRITKAVAEGRIVAIYPEGDSSEKLKRGVANAGRLIATSILKGIPVIYGVSYFDTNSNTYKTAFFNIDAEKIKSVYESLPKSERNKNTGELRGQKVIDFIMIQIAKNLPQEMQGEYGLEKVLRRALKKTA